MDQLSSVLFLSQQWYIQQILVKANKVDCKPISTPMAPPLRHVNDSPPFLHATLYRMLVETIKYLIFTRQEIIFSFNSVCQYMQKLSEHDYSLVKWILKHLKSTSDVGHHIVKNSAMNFYGYIDSDWAGYPLTRWTTTGTVYLSVGIVYHGNRSNIWLFQSWILHISISNKWSYLASIFVWDLDLPHFQPLVLFSNNISAVHLTVNRAPHARSKHIEIDYHFVRERLQWNFLGQDTFQHGNVLQICWLNQAVSWLCIQSWSLFVAKIEGRYITVKEGEKAWYCLFISVHVWLVSIKFADEDSFLLITSAKLDV